MNTRQPPPLGEAADMLRRLFPAEAVTELETILGPDVYVEQTVLRVGVLGLELGYMARFLVDPPTSGGLQVFDAVRCRLEDAQCWVIDDEFAVIARRSTRTPAVFRLDGTLAAKPTYAWDGEVTVTLRNVPLGQPVPKG